LQAKQSKPKSKPKTILDFGDLFGQAEGFLVIFRVYRRIAFCNTSIGDIFSHCMKDDAVLLVKYKLRQSKIFVGKRQALAFFV
jgi:hypothetical protein